MNPIPPVSVIPNPCSPLTRSFQTGRRPYPSVSNLYPPVPVVFNPLPPITTNGNCQYVVKRLQKKLLIHKTEQSPHTVYSPYKNNSRSTDSADSIFLRSSSVRRTLNCTNPFPRWPRVIGPIPAVKPWTLSPYPRVPRGPREEPAIPIPMQLSSIQLNCAISQYWVIFILGWLHWWLNSRTTIWIQTGCHVNAGCLAINGA